MYSSNGTTQLAVSQKTGTSNESLSRTYTAGTYYAKVYCKGNAFNATGCYTLRVALGTASRNSKITNGTKLDLHPNPAKEILIVSLSGYDNEKIIEVTDLMGKVMIKEKTVQSNAALRVNALPAGLYLIKVTTSDGIVLSRGRFVKE